MADFLQAQFGFVAESTYGTRVTPTRFLPFLNESITQEIEYYASQAYRSGRTTDTVRRPGAYRATGDIEMELAPQGFGAWQKQMFGANTTAGAGPYTHTATPGDLLGKSLTIQIGRTLETGTMQPFDYCGCKITQWTLSCGVGELAKVKATIWGNKIEDTSQSLATASYPSGLSPFSFIDASLTIGGTATPVRSLELTGDNALQLDRQRLGSGESKEPLSAGIKKFGGTLVADFTSLTAYNRFKNQTAAALVVTFTSGATSLVITSNVEFDGTTAHAAGLGSETTQPLPFTCLSGTSDAAAITSVLTNADSTA